MRNVEKNPSPLFYLRHNFELRVPQFLYKVCSKLNCRRNIIFNGWMQTYDVLKFGNLNRKEQTI